MVSLARFQRKSGGGENNLSTADMDFQKLADAADKTGIFRGFIEG